jgi:DNA invertase Pin-like site-specific DNA recombinase
VRIDLFLHQQGLDTTTPAGVFAEFERSMIQERVRAGLARANSEGKRLGRGLRCRLRRKRLSARL